MARVASSSGSVRPGQVTLWRRRVGRFLGLHDVHKVAERQVDVIQVEAPGRTERGLDFRAAVPARALICSQVAPSALDTSQCRDPGGDPGFPGRTGRRDEIGRQRRWPVPPRAAGFVQRTCWPRLASGPTGG